MKSNILESFSLSEKKAIVVGGAGDLGRAMVEAISEAGSHTVIIDYDERYTSDQFGPIESTVGDTKCESNHPSFSC